jgi:TATA-box binding protein (TBP) (component of TFIID and TFIIIB)
MHATTAIFRAGRGVCSGSENAADHSAAFATSASVTDSAGP